MHWRCRDQNLDLTDEAVVMGILNVTPDSFSDGGRFLGVNAALRQARRMIAEGAGIIDVGGESTRPGAKAVGAKAEAARVLPVIEAIREMDPAVLISVDTSKAEVARQACDRGAHIINDVTGLTGDPGMAAVAAETKAGLVLMHMQGSPRTMQRSPHYDDVHHEVRTCFASRSAVAREAGIQPEQIVFDPGIGFGKTLEHNLVLLRGLETLAPEGRPLLLGVSRKSLFGKLLGSEVEDRLAATVACTAWARRAGVRIHRVHDVRPNLDAIRLVEALLSP